MSQSLQIKVFLEIPEELRDEYKRLKDECYAWEDTLTQAGRDELADQFCAQADRFKTLVGFVGGNLVAGAKVFKRIIKVDGRRITLGGLGGVWVREEERRKGFATQLNTAGMEELRKEEVEVAYLCTDIEHLSELYKRVGFVHLKQGHTYLGKSGKRYTEYDGMLAPVNSRETFEWLIKREQPLDIGLGNW